ncbi:hypothetical protein ACFFMM_24585 [Micromonospora chaiyaphumensis]|uniref:Uncharacterized protein n=1 Tax=Micromonospora chaiyaphumensis TaxID=307119 RepID=A0A1C4UPD3_9ACTN|nr:hypothetical protein [Micromonospora chaiyaphumensis]SCE73556.1 hypothetical protein GA0070214_101889 [Micromonospora chaiyaphumensis]
MLDLLFFLVVFAPAPLLAIVVLAVRLRTSRGGVRTLAARARAAWRAGLGRPVWPALIAVAAGTAVLTAGLERGYLATVPHGVHWDFDPVLLTIVLGLLAAVGCAALAGLGAAAVSRARGFGAGTVAGLLALVAVAAGTAAAHLPLRAGYLAEPERFPVVPNLADGDLLAPFEFFLAALIWALPWPVLGAALGARTGAAGGRQGVRDVWQLVLDLATADLTGNRSAWGAALRAELAAIDPPPERRAFALGGAWAVLRSGRPPGAWVRAAGVAVVVAGGSFAASRWSLAHDRGGVLGFWTAVPSVLLFAVALAAARRTRSFGAGLRAGGLAGLAALLAVLAVGIPEAAVWAHQHAGYLSTGDAVPPTWQAAVLDVLRPEFVVGMIVFWITGGAGGAALGAAAGRLRGGADDGPVTTASG